MRGALPVVLLTVLLALPAAARRPKPEPCPDGTFLIDGTPFVDAAGGAAGGRVAVSEGTVSLAGLCDPVAARIKATRKATKVTARWSACSGFPKKVLLKASIPATDCETMSGVLRPKKTKPRKQRFTASRLPDVGAFIDELADPDVQARLVDGNFPHTIRPLVVERFPEVAELIAAGPAVLDDILPFFEGDATLLDEAPANVLAYVLEQIGDARAVPVLAAWLDQNLFATTLWATDLVTHAIKVLDGQEGIDAATFHYSVQEKLDTIARVLPREAVTAASVARPTVGGAAERCPRKLTVVGLDGEGRQKEVSFDYTSYLRDIDDLIAASTGSERERFERMRDNFSDGDARAYDGTPYVPLPGQTAGIRSNCGGSVTERILNRVAASNGLPVRLEPGNATASEIRDLARTFGEEVPGADADGFTVISHENGPDASDMPAGSSHVEVPLNVGGAQFSIYSKDNTGTPRSHSMNAAAFDQIFGVGTDGEPSSSARAAMDASFGAPRARYETKLVKFYRLDPSRILDIRVDSSACPCTYGSDVDVAFTAPVGDVDTRVADVAGTVSESTDATGVLRVNGTPQGMTVGGGAFSAQVILRSGDNDLRATIDLSDGRRGCAERTVRSTIAEATLSATLTWTDDDADLDLYVTQPDDETSWYGHHTTTIGGSLDRDDTSGYGPETYSLSADDGDSVLFGDYQVRVHYYSDHTSNDEPSRAVSWRVVIVVNEGKPDEQRIIHEGVLSVDLSSNASPGSSGPDWADVATVTIPEPQPAPGG